MKRILPLVVMVALCSKIALRAEENSPQKPEQAIESSLETADELLKEGRGEIYSGHTQKGVELIKKAVRLEPKRLDLREALAFAYYYNNDLELSQKQFQVILKKYPNNVEALAGMGRILTLSGQDEKAESYLNQALSHDPNRVTPLEFLALLRVKQERHEEAKSLYEKLIEIDPAHADYKTALKAQIDLIQHQEDFLNNQDIYFVIKRLESHEQEFQKEIAKLIQEEKWEEAARRLETDLKIFPKTLENRITLGRMYSYANHQEQALENFLKAQEQSPDREDVKILLGFTYLYLNNVSKSREQFESVLKVNPTSVEALAGLGRLAALDHREEEAEKHYQEALKIRPEDPAALEFLAILRLGQKRYGEAGEIYGRLNRTFPDNKFYKKGLVQVEILPLRDKGNQFEKEKQFEEAEAVYRELLAKDPDEVDYYLSLGRVLVAEKRSDEAIDHYLEALELPSLDKRNRIDLQKALAFTYLWKGMEEEGSKGPLAFSSCPPCFYKTTNGSFQESEGWFESILELEPQEPEALAGLATLWVNTDRFDQAEPLLIEALALSPDNTTVLAYWGSYQSRKRNNFTATDIFARSVDRAPEDEEALKSYKNSTRLIKPVFSLIGFYDEENEKSQFLDVWDARLKDYFVQFNAYVPVADSVAIVGTVRDEYIVLKDLIRGPNYYSFNVQRAKLGVEWGCGPYLTVSGGCGASYFHPYQKSLTHEKTGWFIEPYLRAAYARNHHTVVLETLADSPLVARNFKKNSSTLLGVQIAHASYEYDLGKRRSIGIEGAYGWWHSKVINNQQQVGSVWLQLTPPRFWENISLRYQFVYGRFNDLTPDFYVYRPQLTHWLKLELTKSWSDDQFVATAGYWHGWQRSYEQGQILVVNPLAMFMWRNRQINVVYARIKSKISDNVEISLNGNYSHETFDYTVATASCEIAWRF